MKSRIILTAGILIALAAAVAMTILLSPSVPVPQRTWVAGVAQWKSHEPISVTTHAEQFGVQKGDSFPYLVQVWYDPTVVADVDKASLDRAVNLAPFEVRSIKESDLSDGFGMRVYRREYELQLIAGETNRWYEFPAIIARYRLKDSEGLLNVEAPARPIYVASRLPADVDELDLELMPIAPTVSDLSQRTVPWMLWAVGAVFAVLGAADLVWRVIPRWRGRQQQAVHRAKEGGPVGEAYRALRAAAASSAEPRCTLHQMDHLLRLVLAYKNGQDWLEEPDADGLSATIGKPVAALLDKCHQAYRPVPIEQGEVQEALAELEVVLAHYFGEQEVEAWRS